jgi:outer membrane lipoprotein-sorting protein
MVIQFMRLHKVFMFKTLIIPAVITGLCGFASCAETAAVNPPVDNTTVSVNAILDGLQKAAAGLKSYQCKVEYLFSQPVLESKTLRTGDLHYARFGNGSKLRIDFNTLSQDDGPQQNYKECYIFDGLWLTHIDYQIKQVQKRQLAEANEPIDAFELAKRNFPIIGFGKSEDLNKQFDVNLVNLAGPATARRLYSDSNHNGAYAETSDSNGPTHLQLKVKSDSQYADQYKSVDIWVDKATMLPAKIEAVSTEGDIYEIKFIDPKANQSIDEKAFEFTIPPDFGKPEIIPLKKEQ